MDRADRLCELTLRASVGPIRISREGDERDHRERIDPAPSVLPEAFEAMSRQRWAVAVFSPKIGRGTLTALALAELTIGVVAFGPQTLRGECARSKQRATRVHRSRLARSMREPAGARTERHEALQSRQRAARGERRPTAPHRGLRKF